MCHLEAIQLGHRNFIDRYFLQWGQVRNFSNLFSADIVLQVNPLQRFAFFNCFQHWLFTNDQRTFLWPALWTKILQATSFRLSFSKVILTPLILLTELKFTSSLTGKKR